MSVPENGDGIVYRHIMADNLKIVANILVKNPPVHVCISVRFGAIHSNDIVPRGRSITSEVNAVVFVERTSFVISCRLVQDVNQHRTVLYFCGVAGWTRGFPNALAFHSIFRVTVICEETT